MTIQAHIDSLKNRHDALDGRLASAKSSPSVDDATITEIKKKKLRVKDEIARLETAD